MSDMRITARNRLIEVDKLLSGPDKWTKNVLARIGKGPDVALIICEPDHPDATCWCLIGAVYKVTGGSVLPRSPYQTKLRDKMEDALLESMPKRYGSLSEYNDVVSFRSIKNLIQKAIASLA